MNRFLLRQQSQPACYTGDCYTEPSPVFRSLRSDQLGERDAAEELAVDIDLERRGGDDNAEVDGLLIEVQQLLEDTSCKSALTLGAFSPRSSTLTAVPEESAASFYTHRIRAGVQ